jgi:type 1 glutamine amidotransferase
VAALPQQASVAPKKPRKLLVFWRADAILHKSGVPAANKAIELMGKKTGAYQAYFTRDYEALSPEVLADFDGLVMNSTAHLVIPDAAKRAYLDFVSSGKGVIGIHAAIDTFRDWPEGAAVIGATFGGHPWGPSGTWAIKLDEPNHPLLRAWQGQNFKMHDEVYELDKPFSRADCRVLMSLDTSDAATANVQPLHRADRDFAISYIKRHGAGRVFFCMFGHIGEPFKRKEVLQYYLDGIQYALGDLEVDDSPRTVQQP